MTDRAGWPADRLATIGRLARGCSVWKPTVIGLTSLARRLCPNRPFVCATDVARWLRSAAVSATPLDTALFYGTGGAGYADTHYSATTPGGPNFFYNTDRWGYAAGAGIEWGFAPNWSAKVEYMHYGFDSNTAPIPALSATATADLRLDIDTVKVGINYRFGGPGAKY